MFANRLCHSCRLHQRSGAQVSHRRVRTTGRVTNTQHNGAASQDAQHAPGNISAEGHGTSSHVEMYVVSSGKTPIKRLVPPRPKASAVQQVSASSQQLRQQVESSQVSQQRQHRELKTELMSLASQMQARNTQLGQAEAALRQRDNEIASLRAMLSERDERINNVMTELAEVHEQLRCQESSLQIAYNHLADASRDKARVRQQLIENQAELTGVQSQIAEWSKDLFQLKSIMDTLEEEEQLEAYEPMLSSGTQPGHPSPDGIDDASRPSSLQGMAAELNQKTEAALAGSQDPQDSMTLLEDIASLSKQMVGEAKEDVELFNRASSTSSQ